MQQQQPYYNNNPYGQPVQPMQQSLLPQQNVIMQPQQPYYNNNQYGQPVQPVQQGYYPQQNGMMQQNYPAYQPPVDYGTAQNQVYNYEENKRTYSNMTVDNWNSIPSDSSPYSQNWSSPEAFAPQNVAENMKRSDKCMDKGWTIVFWINFLITMGLFAWLVYEGGSKIMTPQTNSEVPVEEEIDWMFLLKCLGYGFGVALVVNILHGLYACLAPVFYIKFGLLVGFILSIAFGIWAVLYCDIMFIIFPVISLLVTICCYCTMRHYIKFSAVVFKMSTKLLLRHPSLILFTFLSMVISSIISVAFSFIVMMISELNYNYWILFYVVLSFLWISITFSYVQYLVGAGVAATWYFLTDTDQYPSSPVWDSFKRAMTNSFGSAAAAGALLLTVKVIRYLIDSLQEQTDNIFITILLCIAQCALACIEVLISWMNKYGLIYCATFGVPYSEGCRRYMELSCKKYCDLIIRSCVISDSIAYNFIIFVVGGAVLGYAVGYFLMKEEIASIYVCVLACVFAFTIFEILSAPLDVIPDTIMVCFSENPERLKTTASELYDTITSLYNEKLSEVINH